MMFKKILEVFRRESLLDQALSEMIDLLKEDFVLFREVSHLLRNSDSGRLGFDIYGRDKRINKRVREIRRKVLTHLVVSSKKDVTPALILTSVVIDAERIGDYTKNIAELAQAHPQRLRVGDMEERLQKLEATVTGKFQNVIDALEQSDEELANKALSETTWVNREVDKMVQELIQGEGGPDDKGSALACALYVRHLKRINSHLSNVCSSIVVPFPRLGFLPKKGKNRNSENRE